MKTTATSCLSRCPCPSPSSFHRSLWLIKTRSATRTPWRTSEIHSFLTRRTENLMQVCCTKQFSQKTDSCCRAWRDTWLPPSCRR